MLQSTTQTAAAAVSPRLRVPAFLLAFTVALVLFTACGSDDAAHGEHDEEHAGGHEEEVAQLLMNSGKAEWFIEYARMVAGETSQWRIHLTGEEDGKPVTVPRIQMAWTFGKGTQREIEAKRQRPGIYTAAVDVPEAGFARVRFSFSSEQMQDTVVAEKLPVFASDRALHDVPLPEEEEAIHFTKEEAWSMDFRTEPVRRMRFPSIIKTTGHLLSHPSMEVEIPATAGGVLSYEGKSLLPGQPVQQGGMLASIRGGSLSENNLAGRISTAKAELENARADFERAETLYIDNVISQKQLQERKLRLEQAATALRTLNADVQDGGKLLKSPLSGYIKRVHVANGAYVREGDPVLTVARNDRMLLKAELYQSDYVQLASIHGATFRTDDGRTYDIRELNGTLRTRGRAVDASAYSIPIYFEIDGTALLPGEFVDVYLRAGEDVPRLVIPISALTEDLGTFSVYVQRGGERYEKRQVVTGGGDGNYVPVLSGLAEGERIVTRGVHAVRLAASAGQVQAHAHAH